MHPLKIALRSRLIAAGVNGGSAIFDTLAPVGQAYPYILFQYIAGREDTREALDSLNEVWQVKAVTPDHTQAGELALAIRAALHRQPLTISGWRHLWTVQEAGLWQTELFNQQPIYHAGGLFRIQRHVG
jgi:hypothetical protein